MHSADYAVARCLSVRPSVIRLYSLDSHASNICKTFFLASQAGTRPSLVGHRVSEDIGLYLCHVVRGVDNCNSVLVSAPKMVTDELRWPLVSVERCSRPLWCPTPASRSVVCHCYFMMSCTDWTCIISVTVNVVSGTELHRPMSPTIMSRSPKSPNASIYDQPVAINWRFNASVAASSVHIATGSNYASVCVVWGCQRFALMRI